MMTILVTGANGQLGNEMRLVSAASTDRFIFTDVVELPGVQTTILDMTDQDAVRRIVKDNDVKVIVNCAAYTNVDKAEDDVEIEQIEAESATFRSSGSGDIEVDNLTAESINVATTGSGDCTLKCKDAGTLNIQISGSGDITVSGTARAIVNISTTGSGDFNMNRLTLSGK